MTAHMPEDLVSAPHSGRIGEPVEVSTFVLFLASDEGRRSPPARSSSWTAG